MASGSDEDSDGGRSTRPRRRRIRQDSSDSEDGGAHQNPQQHRAPCEPTLTCTTESVKLLVTLLSCLASPGKKETRIRCDADRHGMLFTAHSKGKSLQIKTSLTSELFETYSLAFEPQQGANSSSSDPNDNDSDDDDLQLSFALNLTTLVECLSIFGPGALATTSLRMSYLPQRASLLLVVEDSGVICECALQVLEHDDGNDVGQLEFESAFESAPVVGRCIIQSEPLHEAFAELYDLPSAASVTIAMYGDDPESERRRRAFVAGGTIDDTTASRKCLSLSATSETGSCEIAFGVASKAFIEFFCSAAATAREGDGDGDGGNNNACAATFHVAVLQQAFKALAHSHETFLRLNADGFLSVQHMVESGTGEKAFVDALISPEDTSVQ